MHRHVSNDMNNAAVNPFDLNLARAYSAPAAFCPRPELNDLLTRSVTGQLWTLIVGDRRMGKSSSVIATAVHAKWPILHVDLMGISSEQEVTERFRWAWRLFLQHEARGFFSGIKPVLSARLPGTSMNVKLAADSRDSAAELVTWGDVLAAFDRRVAKKQAILFIDEFQDLALLPDGGKKMSRSLRDALQMTRHTTPILAGSSNHLLAPLFATSAAAFFKAIRLQHQLDPFARERFGSWANEIFRMQERSLEQSALTRLLELTEGITEDLVASCAEVWVQESNQRPITPADIEFGWRSVVANATALFLPKVSALPVSQARLLRYIARNPRIQPFADQTLRDLGDKSGLVYKALNRLLDLELVRQDERDGRKRVWIHDPRLAFYLRT